MKRLHMLYRIILLGVFCTVLTTPFSAAESTGNILVDVKGIKADQGGMLIVALFDKKGSWPKHDSALRRQSVEVTDTARQIKFDQLPLNGTFAVQVLHDRNRNDNLDFRWLPYPRPTEGVGISNNNRRIGPPSFDKALFRLSEATMSISIEMDY